MSWILLSELWPIQSVIHSALDLKNKAQHMNVLQGSWYKWYWGCQALKTRVKGLCRASSGSVCSTNDTLERSICCILLRCGSSWCLAQGGSAWSKEFLLPHWEHWSKAIMKFYSKVGKINRRFKSWVRFQSTSWVAVYLTLLTLVLCYFMMLFDLSVSCWFIT
jgi:hypothetical protein